MDSESSFDHETLHDEERPAGRRWYDSHTRKPEWISYGLLALLYVLILVLFITVYSGDNVSSTRKDLVTLKEMNDFRERVHNLSSAMDDLHTSLKEKTCEDGWKKLDDSCYSFTVVEATWSQTRDSCLKKGADLASITSEREQYGVLVMNGLRFTSINAKGLNSPSKRHSLELLLRRYDTKILFLQETHYKDIPCFYI
ncbi:CD209 antigen-like protein A isoform X2 [Eleutherodactylus coqui]|uniref:CD209 antigen-like protein A isoform X2 n=1 Tax=Eleutherodactylus coqui TaxID=57060 RepID=UPI0034618D6E